MILMVGCLAGDNRVMSLDDVSVWQDDGTPYPAWMLTNPVDFGTTDPYGRLRKVAQAVTVGGETTVTITPYADGSDYAGQAVSTALNATVGETQIVTAEPAVEGRRFSYRVDVAQFTNRVELGSADLDMIEHRG